jgi:hypothetical protein
MDAAHLRAARQEAGRQRKKTARRGHGWPGGRKESGGDRIRANRVSLGKNRGASKAPTRNPTLCPRAWPRLPPSGTACPLPSGLGSWQWCVRRQTEAWLDDERSRTAPRLTRQSSWPAADLDLVAGPSPLGENASPSLSCGFEHVRYPGKSVANQFLDANESLSYGGPQVRVWSLSQEVFRGEVQ